jgi:O-antigen ligase
MQASQLTRMRRSFLVELVGAQGRVYFWNMRFLPRWLPFLFGAALAMVSAYLIVKGQVYLALCLALAVPAIVVLVRYPFVAVLIWLLVFPFFVREPSALGEIMYWLLHRVMIPFALLLTILSDWFGLRVRPPVRFGRAELIMLFFFVLALANILLMTGNPARAFMSFYDRLIVPFCMYALVRLTAPSAQDIERLLPVAFVTVIIQGSIGLLSWFAPQALPEQWLRLAGDRTVGTFGNAAVYTSTLIFLSLFLLHHTMQTRSAWVRPLFIFAVGLSMFCIFFSFSRGSWLGGLVVLLGWSFLYPKVILRVTVVILILFVALGQTVLAKEVAFAIERLNNVRSAESRVIQNGASLKMIEARPWLGWGYGNYERYNREFVARVGDVAVQKSTTSHNTYLTLTVEMGLVGLALYAFSVAWWLFLSLRVWRRLPRAGVLGRSMLVLLWLLILDHVIVSNFMDMIRYNLFGTTVFWMALGFIANTVHFNLQVEQPRVSTQTSLRLQPIEAGAR